MANTTSVQILVDGPRNVVLKYEGTLDTSDLSKETVVDPALLSDMEINGVKASQLRINKINYDVEAGLAVNLYWDATTDVIIWNLYGRGEVNACKYGGLVNNSGTGKTGKILADTQGYTSGTLTFTIILELVKQ